MFTFVVHCTIDVLYIVNACVCDFFVFFFPFHISANCEHIRILQKTSIHVHATIVYYFFFAVCGLNQLIISIWYKYAVFSAGTSLVRVEPLSNSLYVVLCCVPVLCYSFSFMCKIKSGIV